MAKKRSSTKSTQSTAKTTNKKAPAKQTRAADYENQEKRAPSRSQRSAFAKIAPYVMSVFALVLAVCFVTVQLLGMDDGAGIVGYYIQMFFCGLFGIAAFILPLVLGYVGMKWCFYNVKFKTKGNSDEQKKARRRLVLQAVMSCLSLLMIATIIGVIEDYGSFDLVGFWEDGASLVGGGIFGSSLGYLFVLCFEVAISLIIIIPLLVVFVMLTFGITPNYVLEKIQASHDRKAEEKKKLEEEEEEYDQYYAEEEEKIRKEELKKAAAIAAREAKAQREAQEREEKKRAQETSVDEIMGLNTETGEVFELGNDTDKSADATDIFFENTGADKAAAATPKKAANTSAASQPQEEILDFGGDSAFDNDEYKGIDEIFDAIKTVPYSSNKEPVRKEAAPAKEIKDEPKETPAKPLDLTKMDDDEVQADMANVALDEGDREEEEIEAITPYIFPPVDLLAVIRTRETPITLLSCRKTPRGWLKRSRASRSVFSPSAIPADLRSPDTSSSPRSARVLKRSRTSLTILRSALQRRAYVLRRRYRTSLRSESRFLTASARRYICATSLKILNLPNPRARLPRVSEWTSAEIPFISISERCLTC
ncbi:MAG: DNA translocase FtsK 4TM domain-containing protein [Clostridia bacterium]|nr:DNA translocase FtsK 4TM domain-containing protein [Clostridia bacterium]